MNCPANLWGNRDYSSSAAPRAADSQAALTERAFVTANGLNIRAGAGTESAIIGRLSRGAEVIIVERDGDWARLAADRAQSGGWVSSSFLSAEAPPPERTSDAQIRQLIMQQSLSYYSGSCPCPYNVDRAGRRCGRRSAYSRPGGASPLCYPSEVSDAQVRAFRSRQRRLNAIARCSLSGAALLSLRDRAARRSHEIARVSTTRAAIADAAAFAEGFSTDPNKLRRSASRIRATNARLRRPKSGPHHVGCVQNEFEVTRATVNAECKKAQAWLASAV